jgi:branched-chain amino acid transport system permease protein
MDYLVHLAIIVCIYLILAQSFNLTFGLGGLFNLAHVAVYAIGAYTTALLSTELGQGFWVCIAASTSLSALFALIIGAISLKLTHDYFAIGTLAFSAVVSALLINWKSLTRGVLGIPGIPRPELFGIDFYENRNFLVLISIFVVVTFVILHLFFSSRFARRLRMQSEHEPATHALAVSITAIRRDSFIVSSAFAGLAGSFFAYYINYIDPSSFGLHEMVFILSIVIVGRPSSFWGVTLATFFLVLLPEPLRFIDINPSILGPMRQLLYSLILFAVVYWKREKLFPVQRTL